MWMKCYKFSTSREYQGSMAKPFFVKLELCSSVSSAFTTSQLVMCILQVVTELLMGSGCTAVAFLWPLENLKAAKNYLLLLLFI